MVFVQVGMDKQVGEDTRLLYCTTGILLNRLISRKHMRDYTHIILDEVHERDQNSDFCLLVVRKLLRSNSTNVKVRGNDALSLVHFIYSDSTQATSW
jgi:ATP-dependent RNA helicase TDRD9